MEKINYNEIISEIYLELAAIEDKGELATYIPELANVNPDCFGIQISTPDNYEFGIGNFSEKFSIQSHIRSWSAKISS